MSKVDYETIIRTCTACPSQWEGLLTDGRMFYARLRHGHFYVEFSKKPVKDVMELFDDCDVVLQDESCPEDGYMTDWEFYRRLLKANLLEANLSTRLTIKYFGRILSYIEERSFSKSLFYGIRRIQKYGLFGKPPEEE